MAISIADKLAALRAARNQPKYESYGADSDESQPRVHLPDGSLSIHDDIFRAALEAAGREDIDFLLSRPVDERAAILQAIELNPQIVMRFLYVD